MRAGRVLQKDTGGRTAPAAVAFAGHPGEKRFISLT